MNAIMKTLNGKKEPKQITKKNRRKVFHREPIPSVRCLLTVSSPFCDIIRGGKDIRLRMLEGK